MKKTFVMAILLAFGLGAYAQKVPKTASLNVSEGSPKEIILPEPQKDGGKPLMDCLRERKSLRKFSHHPLDMQILSNLLWASYGINRDDGRRTAPTARNAQDITLYVAMENGIYLWESRKNVLMLVRDGDFRMETGKQDFVKDAQWNIIIVSDISKYGEKEDISAVKYGAMSAGYVSENMYLFCASADLATVARGMFDQNTLKKLLQLTDQDMVMLVHSVGAQ
ncbi:MAG: SagB/ThcOx family dehydrogenase [Bacteroidales bacterium]|jgi:SagB-type dehydrogenase family enzyme|nr:SagB/ThcOx family dehydrogenase [Bacteroidales bacterium]